MSEKSQKARHAIDPIFKQVLTEKLTPLAVDLQTEVEVSRLPRTIDALVRLTTPKQMRQVHETTPFFYFSTHNQVEFKGRNDPLTIAGRHLISGRTQLYLGEQNASVHEMTVTIVCAGKPRTVFAHTQSFQPFHSIAAGYYKNAEFPPVTLIVVNELPVIAKNYPLLLFASNESKFRQVLDQFVASEDATYIRYAYEVRPKLTKEVLTMARYSSRFSSTLTREDLEFMAEDIGRELLAFLPPEDRLVGISPEDRLAGISPKDRLAGIRPEDRLSGISPEDRLAGIRPEDRLSGISDEELLSAIDTGVLLTGLNPEHRIVLHELLLTMRAASDKNKKVPNGSHTHE